MKKVNRLFTLLLAMLMVVSMALPAMAEEDPPSQQSSTYTITVEGSNDKHTYEAYQIFTGDIAGTTLSTIRWGNGVTEAGQQAAYEEYGADSAGAVADKLLTTEDAKAFAEFIGDYLVEGNAYTSQLSGNLHTISELPAGYYLVKDQDNSLDNAESTSYTSYILHLAGNVTVRPKSTSPSLDKTVSDINDSTRKDYENFLESADHDIGDDVPYRLNSVLGNIDPYTTYNFKIIDELSKGLTFNDDAVITYGGEPLTEGEHYTISTTPGTDGGTIVTYDFGDILEWESPSVHTGGLFVVLYTAKLNENAVIGGQGNPNTAYLEYSNNPYDNESTGETTKDTAVVFTYKVVVDKTDGTAPLPGAGFTLYKNDIGGNWIEVEQITAGETTTFSFEGLDDGEYRLVETATPSGYNKIEPIEFNIVAEHTDKGITSLTGDLVGGVVEIVFTPSTAAGSLTTTVVNESGAVLPSTGGIGTTIFYAVGGLLVCAALVLLITKKRMNAEN